MSLIVGLIGMLTACGERQSPVAVQPAPVGEHVLPEGMGTVRFNFSTYTLLQEIFHELPE
jgi:hypothetical protein